MSNHTNKMFQREAILSPKLKEEAVYQFTIILSSRSDSRTSKLAPL
jgi:hypothetical protein